MKESPFNLEIWLPFDEVKQQNNATTQIEDEAFVLQRSVSGSRVFTSVKCDYLPPLSLNLILYPKYPSEEPPHFSIASSWLSLSQLEELCVQLDNIWLENKNTAVIFTFVEWLKSNTISHLGIFREPNKLIITPYTNLVYRNKIYESRITSEFQDIQNCIYNLLK